MCGLFMQGEGGGVFREMLDREGGWETCNGVGEGVVVKIRELGVGVGMEVGGEGENSMLESIGAFTAHRSLLVLLSLMLLSKTA